MITTLSLCLISTLLPLSGQPSPTMLYPIAFVESSTLSFQVRNDAWVRIRKPAVAAGLQGLLLNTKDRWQVLTEDGRSIRVSKAEIERRALRLQQSQPLTRKSGPVWLYEGDQIQGGGSMLLVGLDGQTIPFKGGQGFRRPPLAKVGTPRNRKFASAYANTRVMGSQKGDKKFVWPVNNMRQPLDKLVLALDPSQPKEESVTLLVNQKTIASWSLADLDQSKVYSLRGIRLEVPANEISFENYTAPAQFRLSPSNQVIDFVVAEFALKYPDSLRSIEEAESNSKLSRLLAISDYLSNLREAREHYEEGMYLLKLLKQEPSNPLWLSAARNLAVTLDLDSKTFGNLLKGHHAE